MPNSGIGGAFERLAIIADRFLMPSAIRKQGEAKADAAWREAHMQEEIENLKHRGRIRRELEETRYEQNLQSIAGQARDLIPMMEQKLLPPPVPGQEPKAQPGESPAPEPDQDWFFKFTGFAKQTSDRDFQVLWAKVLAGEAVQQGRFSLRLLQHIALMRRADADAFQKFARCVWLGRPPLMFQIANEEVDQFLAGAHGLDEDFYVTLHHSGLIDNSGSFVLDLKPHSNLTLVYGNYDYVFNNPGDARYDRYLRVRQLTPLGRELYLLCDPEPDPAYVDRLKDSLQVYNIMFASCTPRLSKAPTARIRQTVYEESTWLP